MCRSNSGIADDEQPVSVVARADAEHDDALEALRGEQRIPFAGVLRFQRKREKKTQDDDRKIVVHALGFQLRINVSARQDRKKTTFARLRSQQVNGVPTIELENNIGLRIFVKTWSVVGYGLGLGGFTSGQQQRGEHDGKQTDR